jgi:coenzyme F420-reducing hydrogenase gamma subunit
MPSAPTTETSPVMAVTLPIDFAVMDCPLEPDGVLVVLMIISSNKQSYKTTLTLSCN